ncbi:MAG: efflux RND transporter periplasmic adaptor subunit [Nitrosospira sp.]
MTVGQVVRPSDQLFKMADLSSVWVVGDVPEQVAHNVRVGQHVEIRVPALDGASFDGRNIFVVDTENPLNPYGEGIKADVKTSTASSSLPCWLPCNRFLPIPVELGPEVADMARY